MSQNVELLANFSSVSCNVVVYKLIFLGGPCTLNTLYVSFFSAPMVIFELKLIYV